MLNPNIKLPPCITREIIIKREHFKGSNSADALLSPVALAIKPLLRSDCDVLATSKQVLYYSVPFNRKDINIVLGESREAIINLPDEVIKVIKLYEETGAFSETKFSFPVPKSLLDT